MGSVVGLLHRLGSDTRSSAGYTYPRPEEVAAAREAVLDLDKATLWEQVVGR